MGNGCKMHGAHRKRENRRDNFSGKQKANRKVQFFFFFLFDDDCCMMVLVVSAIICLL